jgi:Mg2+ and Co2+ transporter CorA
LSIAEKLKKAAQRAAVGDVEAVAREIREKFEELLRELRRINETLERIEKLLREAAEK